MFYRSAQRLISRQAWAILALVPLAHAPLHSAWAAGATPMAEKSGYRCLYSRHVTQDASACVVGYFDKNGVLIGEDITEQNIAQVAYYRVLLDKDESGRLRISSYYPGGQKRTDAIAVGRTDNMLAETSMAKLGADGAFRHWYEDGRSREVSAFREGRLTGFSQSWFPNGQLQFDGEYVDDALHGRIVTYYSSGQMKQESHYKLGKLDGSSTVWHENGIKSAEARYDYGRLVGAFTTWHPNGKKKAYSHRHYDAIDGTYTEWYENGQKKREENYDRGALEGEATYWYANGQRSALRRYTQDLSEGLSQMWYDNGQIKAAIQNKNGKEHGPFFRWHWNGKKQLVGQFVDGKLDGVVTLYELDGSSTESLYERGVLRTARGQEDGQAPASPPRHGEETPVALPMPKEN